MVLLVLTLSACGEDTSSSVPADVAELCREIRSELAALPTAVHVGKVAEFVRAAESLPVAWPEADEAAGLALTGDC